MNYFTCLLCAIFIFATSSCAMQPKKASSVFADAVPIDEIEILSKFQTVDLTRNILVNRITTCVPQINTNSPSMITALSRFPSKSITTYSHTDSASIFWMNNSTGMCLRRSSGGHLILALESFINTVNPNGVPLNVTDLWFKKIALVIAKKGTAKVAFEFDNGNAFVADYWVEREFNYLLKYSNSFRKAGKWENEPLDMIFSHSTMSSVTSTKRNQKSEKLNLLEHRASRRTLPKELAI